MCNIDISLYLVRINMLDKQGDAGMAPAMFANSPLQEVEWHMFIHEFARKYPAVVLKKEQVKSLILHCFDARFEWAMDGFIIQELCLDRGTYKVMQIPGGPAPLAYSQTLKRECDELAHQLLIVSEAFPYLDKIVLIMHGCCAYYHFVPMDEERKSVMHYERDDCLPVQEYVQSIFPDKNVESCYAYLVNDDTTVAFQRIFATQAELDVFRAESVLIQLA